MLRIEIKSISSPDLCYDCNSKATYNIDIFENNSKYSNFGWNSCEICWNFNKKVIEKYEVKDVLYFVTMRNKDDSVVCNACNKVIEADTFYVQLKQYNYNEKRNCCLNPKCIEYLKLILC